MLLKRKSNGRIFINYRRSDSQGYAGRLSDSLESYFGDNRVFRDIEDITGGAEFAKTIETNLHSADAMIVLIGPNWLTAVNDDGKRRLDNPDDWVIQEIDMAIQKGVRLFPVIIEGAPMPRRNELPDKIAPLLNYNTVTISDRNWNADVLGLGKIISIDIPSTNERILYWAKLTISLLLFCSIIFSTALFTWNYFIVVKPPLLANTIDSLENFYSSSDAVKDESKDLFISFGLFGIPYIGIILSLGILIYFFRNVAEERKRYIIYSIASGATGTLITFIIIYPLESPLEETAMFLSTVLTVSLMFAFLNMSGFKSK